MKEETVTQTTAPMGVRNMAFFLEKVAADCAPHQFIRELTQNAIEAVLATADGRGEIIWDRDELLFKKTGLQKLCVIDQGIGMTGDEMAQYINNFSSSGHEQSSQGNFGAGAKIAAAPFNRLGLVYTTWKGGQGAKAHLWKDPRTGEYGFRKEDVGGVQHEWVRISNSLRPPEIRSHGTKVVLLGNSEDDDTITGTSMWVVRYLNSRYFRIPAGVTIKARQFWGSPDVSGKGNWVLRTVRGQEDFLKRNAIAGGTVQLTRANAHWWILDELTKRSDSNAQYISSGHVATLYQNELYDLLHAASARARFRAFGIVYGESRVVIYVEPSAGDVVSSFSRSQLVTTRGEQMPWSEWAEEFRAKMPTPLVDFMDRIAAKADRLDDKDMWKRLQEVWDLFKLSRYKPTRSSDIYSQMETPTQGGEPESGVLVQCGDRPSGAAGGKLASFYALHTDLSGTPMKELPPNHRIRAEWISAATGTRADGYLEDRAGEYVPEKNTIYINSDFRLFTDFVQRMAVGYPPYARPDVEATVKQWFQQQLVETVLTALSLRGQYWESEDLEKMWSPEALTAAVAPRQQLIGNVRKSLAAQLGIAVKQTA